MDQVKVDRDELKGVVTKNREAHHRLWEEAFEGYRRACIDALESNLTAFRAGKAQRVFINEQPPENHTKDYDRVLRMLDMSLDDSVTLTSEAFAQYVMDEWNWKEHWTVMNTKYLPNR